MSTPKHLIQKFQQDLMMEKNGAINTLSHYTIREISELSWQLNQELQQHQRMLKQQRDENTNLKIVFMKILDLLDKSYTSQELEKLYEDDQQTFENIKNRISKNQFLQQSSNNQKTILQENYDTLFNNYKGLFSRNFKFYEDHKKIFEAQQSYIDTLKKESDELRNKIFDYSQCILEYQNQQNHKIQNYPGYEVQCNQIDDELGKIKVQSQQIYDQIILIQEQSKQTNQEQSKLIKSLHEIIGLINDVKKNSKTLMNILQSSLLQIDDKVYNQFKKTLDYVQLNLKICERFELLLQYLLQNSKKLQDQNEQLSENLNKINQEVKDQKEQYEKVIEKCKQNFKGSSNNYENQGISINQTTYYKFFKEFSVFVMTFFELLPFFRDYQEQYKDQLMQYRNSINQPPSNIQEIKKTIEKFQEILKNFKNHISEDNNIAKPLHESIKFIENLQKLTNSGQLADNQILIGI